MKKIISSLLNIIRGFIFNSFWRSWTVLAIIFLSLVLNAILWYIFLTKIKVNVLPFYFASGLIILNLLLANFLWEKEKLASYFLIAVGIFSQILMLVFIRFLTIIF